MALQSRVDGTTPRRRIDSSHYLYIAVIAAVAAGIAVGLAAPEFAVGLKPIGDAFVLLIKMMIAPIIFCTIVLGVGSIAKAATVGKVGGLALLYFMVMSTFALGIGIVVGNLVHPGEGLNIAGASYDAGTGEAKTTTEFLLGIIPTSMLSSLTDGNILQVLFVALLVGFALQKMGPKGTPILGAIRQIRALRRVGVDRCEIERRALVAERQRRRARQVGAEPLRRRTDQLQPLGGEDHRAVLTISAISLRNPPGARPNARGTLVLSCSTIAIFASG